MSDGFYFAQLTDVHVGEGLNPQEAARNMRWGAVRAGGVSSPECVRGP